MPDARVLFLVPYPSGTAPSQRFRVELFLPELTKAGIPYAIEPFIDARTWKVLYKRGYFFSKALGLCWGFIKRWWILFARVPFYDYVFIHRETSPLGPPIFEWIIAKIFKKRIIYDFDDAIWISNTSSANHFINWLKASWKVKHICRWAYKITAGNDYLYHYAIQFNQKVIKIPTCVDIEKGYHEIKRHREGILSVGWTGSHSTLKYLDQIIPVINELQKEIDFNFLVIADKNPFLSLRNFQFIPWNSSTEQEDLLKLDIGVMPLVADAWSEGKCGFKLIQYYAGGIPAVASPVGINKIIVEHEVNGFLCDTNDEWKFSLGKLLANKFLREQMGDRGRKKISKEYSLQSQTIKFIELFS